MDQNNILKIISKGEDSKTQFKLNITNETQIAQEMVAFSNSKGGTIIIGIGDNGDFKGISNEDIRRFD